MPAQYLDIRDSEVARGVPYKKAQSIAAATYNTQHQNAPITGKAELTPTQTPAPPRMNPVHEHLRQHMRQQALLQQMGK